MIRTTQHYDHAVLEAFTIAARRQVRGGLVKFRYLDRQEMGQEKKSAAQNEPCTRRSSMLVIVQERRLVGS